MTVTNEIRRQVMSLAWGLYRGALNGTDPRSFADALAGAWRWIKRQAKAKAPRWARTKGTVYFASPVCSATDRALRGQAYAGARSRQAASHFAAFGR